MLKIFRKYQRLLFVLVTGVIICTFSLFGAYGGFSTPTHADGEAFTSVDGRTVTRSELGQMQLFLASDSTDKLFSAGLPGPNFLNDGVVRRDVLQAGLGELLVEKYIDQLEPDLRYRYDRERRFAGYQHPHAPFLSAENVWATFAPSLRGGLDNLRDIKEPLSKEAFNARASLYLAEQNFPQNALKEVLRFQEKQHDWVQPDSLLERRDLALFGYHTLEDWFGPRFLTLVSEFVINASIIAHEQGYRVSKAEAWADLQRNAELNFRQIQHSPHVKAANSQEYLEEQLRLMGMDRASATKTWQKVMLFRRYFADIGNVALLDTMPFEKFQSFAGETIETDLYTLGTHLNTYRDLQAFEVYREAVSDDDNDLPASYKSVDQVLVSYPEFVQKPYELEITSVETDTIRKEIPLRQIWEWQLDESNWAALTAKEPSLAATSPSNQDERFAELQKLDKAARQKLDKLAQDALIAANPSLITQALDQTTPTTELVRLTFDEKVEPLPGLHGPTLMAELEQHEALSHYSEDGEHHYRFHVLQRPAAPSLMTFNQAVEAGAAERAARRYYLAHYKKVRKENPDAYQYHDFSWKRLEEVRDSLADELLAGLLDGRTGEEAAHHRFDSHLLQSQADTSTCVRTEPESLENQWLLTKSHKTFERSSSEPTPYDLAVGAWSSIQTGPGEAPSFFCVTDRREGTLAHKQRVDFAREALAAEARCQLMHEVLSDIQTRNGISLQMFDQTTDA